LYDKVREGVGRGRGRESTHTYAHRSAPEEEKRTEEK